MAYTEIAPKATGTAGSTPADGSKAVYQMTVLAAGTFRVQADPTGASAAFMMELHLNSYPATSFTPFTGYKQAKLPAGTHYVTIQSSPGGVGFNLWRQRIVKGTTCPTGCVKATQAAVLVRDAVVHALRQAGQQPPPADAPLATLAPPHVAQALMGRPRAARAARPPAPRPVPQAARPLTPGIAERVTLSARAPSARFSARGLAHGFYTVAVDPGPLSGVELFYLDLLGPAGRRVAGSTDGTLAARLGPGEWTLVLALPRAFLGAPRTFDVTLKEAIGRP